MSESGTAPESPVAEVDELGAMTQERDDWKRRALADERDWQAQQVTINRDLMSLVAEVRNAVYASAHVEPIHGFTHGDYDNAYAALNEIVALFCTLAAAAQTLAEHPIVRDTIPSKRVLAALSSEDATRPTGDKE